MKAWYGRVVLQAMLLTAARPSDAAPDARLADAMQRQDVAAVATLLGQHVDPNGQQADGTTALAWAAHWNDVRVADTLLAAGADVNVGDDLGVTPLMLACRNGSLAMAERLLAAGADAGRSRKTGETPLMTAAFTGNVALVKALLARGADPNAATHDSRQTALMWAIAESHGDVTGALIAARADVRARSAGGFTPLLFAARQGDLASARLLLDAGADPNDKAKDGNSALVVAAASGREELVLLLLERGADPNASGAGYTALHVAIPKNLRRAVTALLARHADVNARVRTAPATLFGPGRGAGSEVPAIAGASVRPLTSAGSFADATPFWLAAKHVNVELMELLRAGGADMTLTNDAGTTALMVAAGVTQIQGPRAKRGDVSQFYSNWGEADAHEAVRYLLNHGAAIDARNASGQTALHGAAYMGGTSLVTFLLDQGAAINVQDAQGQTPYRLAEAHLNVASQGVSSWPQTAALLKTRGADTTLGVDGRALLRRYTNASAGSTNPPAR